MTVFGDAMRMLDHFLVEAQRILPRSFGATRFRLPDYESISAEGVKVRQNNRFIFVENGRSVVISNRAQWVGEMTRTKAARERLRSQENPSLDEVVPGAREQPISPGNLSR
jgi:hypothetical protein